MSPLAKPALAIMARAPIPGKAKTRFQPYLTPEESASIAAAFLRDALDLATSVKIYTSFLFYTPPDQEALFKGLSPSSVSLLPQSEGDLGQKMHDIFLQLGNGGYSPVVLIGSDIPTLQPSHLEAAAERLEVSEVCLGPSQDGGYYLIGARRAHQCLFEGIPWSTSGVLEATIAKAKAAGLSVSLLEPCTDVDTVQELRWVPREIERLARSKGARVPRWTEACLRQITF